MTFAKQYDIKHTMSSPYYHESNGKAECYVRIVKNLLKKQRSNINDALLAYRSAPLCNSKHSPAELMFNRQMKDNILTIPIHFKSEDLERINNSQESKYKDLHSGDRVFIFDTDKKVWEKGMIINKTEHQISIVSCSKAEESPTEIEYIRKCTTHHRLSSNNYLPNHPIVFKMMFSQTLKLQLV